MERFALYFAPAKGSALDETAERWLAQPDLLATSARRYGFHATIKAPMTLKPGLRRQDLEAELRRFAENEAPVHLSTLQPQLIDGFLALVSEPQPEALTEFAARVVAAFDGFRAPLSPADRARRLQAPLSERQVELVDLYGYPYVFEQFRFHMTLSDRLPSAEGPQLLTKANDWFAPALAQPVLLDRLVLFHEEQSGAPFQRLDDFPLNRSSSV